MGNRKADTQGPGPVSTPAPPLAGAADTAPDAAELGIGRLRPRMLAVAAVLLLVGSATGFVWHGRTQRLDQAAALAVQRVNRLADDLAQTLALAQVAMAQTDAHLQALPPATSLAGGLRGLDALATHRAELLAALPLPFELHALAADGRAIDLAAAPSANPGPRPPYPAPVVPTGTWAVGSTQGPPDTRTLQLLRPAAPNTRGVVAFAIELTHRALQDRFESDRLPPGGSVVLHRVEPDGSAIVLARAPLVETQINQRVQGPLAQALAQAPSGVFVAPGHLDGVHRIVAYRRLDGDAAALVLAYGVATDDVLAGWHAVVPGIAAITLLLAAGMAFGGWRLDTSLRLMASSRRALARSELHFRTLADNLPDVVVRLDRQGRHLYANAAVAHATGLPSAAFIGKTNTELGMPAENVARWMACLQRVFETGHADRLEFSFAGPNGETHWESQLVLEPAGNGDAPTALVISRDISERRRADAALRASESRLNYLLRSAPTVIYTAMTQGDFSATYYSPNLQELLGWQPAQFIADPGFWLNHVHPDDREALLLQMDQLPQHGEAVLEYRFAHADGRWRWMRDAVRLLRDDAGAPTELVGSWIDITDRREAEAELARQRNALECTVQRRTAELDRSVAQLRQANQELETFTYSVSHDLKAPLRGIDGYSRLLLSDHQDRLDDEGRAFLGHIRQATQHMGVLIDDLLTYSRLERRDLTLNPLPLAALVDSALVGFQPDLAARGVRLDIHIPPDLQARADAQGLTMSVRNLLDNALKFSATRQPPHITITGTRTEDGVLLAFQDNGLGFDMRFHDRIFAIFQRLHRAEDYPGTGVGLAIVRKAMERMGGRVWAVSQPGQGATFTLQLPEAR